MNSTVLVDDLASKLRQREAVLALISSVQTWLLAKLEMCELYEMIGDRLRGRYDAQVTGINTLDHDSSLEFVDEAMDEVVMLETQAKEKQSIASPHGLSGLLSDIKSNLAKIHEHGLGKMEPTDLNALVSEFVNLSYHGMRAGKDPIEAEVTLDLEDNGLDIPDEINDKILQPFFTTKKGTRGTGLGLSITHDIVKAHGDGLEIESEAGRTVFRIKLNG